MARVTITLDYPQDIGQYSDNKYYSGQHWNKRKRDAEYWHTRLQYEAPWNRPPLKSPVKLTFYWNDRLDLSNHGMLAKMIEDGIKHRIIQDDSRNHVCEIVHRWHDENNIKIEVEEMT